MRALVQRVSRAEVRVEGERGGSIGPGLLIFVCAVRGDSVDEARLLAHKIAHLRIFADKHGKMNRSIQELESASNRALVVSQFTLSADTRKGRRPSFVNAASAPEAICLLDAFRNALHACGITSETGIFGAHMEVALVNDGPVTIWLDTDDWSSASGDRP